VVPWPVPADGGAPEPVVVPKVAGLSVRAAAAALHRRGFQVTVAGSGAVSGSDPVAGTSVKFGTTVRLQVE
jgi:beta-lactam-binding protein with PASTA domain